VKVQFHINHYHSVRAVPYIDCTLLLEPQGSYYIIDHCMKLGYGKKEDAVAVHSQPRLQRQDPFKFAERRLASDA